VIAFARFFAKNERSVPDISPVLVALRYWFGILTAVGFVWTGLVCFLMSRKMRAASVDELLAKDPRPPVVYLRSFGDDGRPLKEGFVHELERGASG
jgi:hypothetical protein